MRLRKVFASVVVLVALLLNMVAFAEEQTEKVAPNTNEITILRKLGVISSESFLDITVTRVELLQVVATLKGYNENDNYASQYMISGVLPGDGISSVLVYSYYNGLIDNIDNFNPYDAADYNFTSRLLTNALGYGPTAYTGTSFSITKQITSGVDYNGTFTTEKCAKMLCNALDTKVLVLNSINPSNDYSYNTYDGETLLYRSKKITKINDRVTETAAATLTGSYVSIGNIRIGNDLYNDRDMQYTNLIGYYVVAYADDDKNLIYAFPTQKENEILKVDSRDICSASNKNIVYYSGEDNNKRRITKAISNPIVIYNGKNLKGNQYSDELFDIDEGDITIISGSSGNSDVMFINSLKNILVGATNFDTFTVYEKLDKEEELVDDTKNEKPKKRKELVIDTKNNKMHILKNASGARIQFSDIPSGSLITYAVSLDGEVVTAYLTTTKIETAAEEITDTTIKLDGKAYYFNPSLETAKKLDINAKYAFYININGNIAAIDHIQFVGMKGFLLNAGKAEGLDGNVLIKVAKADSDADDPKSIPIYTCDKKVTVDGVKGLKGDAILTALLTNKVFVQMPIMFTLNSEGKVIDIDTPNYNAGVEDEKSLREIYSESSGVLYSFSMSRFGFGICFSGKYIMDANALMLKPDATDPLGTNFTFPNPDYQDSCYVSIYSANGAETFIGDFAIFNRKGGSSNKYSLASGVVKSLSKVTNENGEEVLKIKMRISGNEETRFVNSSATAAASALKAGDIIYYSLNRRGEIIEFQTEYNYESKQYTGSTAKDYPSGDAHRPVYGIVKSVDDNVLTLYLYGNTANVELHCIQVNDLWCYTAQNGALKMSKEVMQGIRTADYCGMDEADRIYFHTTNNIPGSMYLIR